MLGKLARELDLNCFYPELLILCSDCLSRSDPFGPALFPDIRPVCYASLISGLILEADRKGFKPFPLFAERQYAVLEGTAFVLDCLDISLAG